MKRLVLSLSLVLSFSALPSSAQTLTLQLLDREVAVSGLSPGGRAVFFGVAREIEDYAAKEVRLDQVLTDDDRDGAVRFDLERPLAHASIWVVVDLATGRWQAATPKGYPLELRRTARSGPARGDTGTLDRWQDDLPFLELLVVRPGVAAWGSTVGDGGPDDEDGQVDERLAASLGRMRPAQRGPVESPPERFRKGDLVFAIDPERMDLLGVALGDEVER